MKTSKGYSPLIVSPSLRTCRTLLLAPQRSLQEGLMTPWVFTVAAGEGSGHCCKQVAPHQAAQQTSET